MKQQNFYKTLMKLNKKRVCKPEREREREREREKESEKERREKLKSGRTIYRRENLVMYLFKNESRKNLYHLASTTGIGAPYVAQNVKK
jgi:hypothetical protein